MSIKLSSTAFKEGGLIPQKYTCEGDSVSPPLKWDRIPANAKSIVITIDDPDAPGGDFVHWVAYDIPADARGLREGLPAVPELDNGGKNGLNSAGGLGFTGPCPSDGVHRYYFKIFALDHMLSLPAGQSRQQVVKAMKPHVIDDGIMVAKYGKVTSGVMA